ncbi:uncharacterized protein LOC127799153 [Diospyros lotus]|uniref:uncharacterized protein LOC127799153 n=1 Tax=Diospyros lotus TaxID=55363 RepID=UPI00224F2CF6|nr:uncharacterized protein LOC127799153 [Diospyros lotus]
MEAIALEDPAIIAPVEAAEIKKLEGKIEAPKKNKIQVSNTKKPLFFYLNLAKRCIKKHNDVVLSALGMAIPTVVTIAEILKANGVAMEKQVLTSTVGIKDEAKGRMVQKPKIEIVLERTQNGVEKNQNGEKTNNGTVPEKNQNDVEKNQNGEKTNVDAAPEKNQNDLEKNQNGEKDHNGTGPENQNDVKDNNQRGVEKNQNGGKTKDGTAPEGAAEEDKSATTKELDVTV